jgi:arylsulfatase A-like enzyme
LVPQLKNPDKKKKSLTLTSFQFWGDSAPSHAVSDHRYRLIHYPDGFEELYDLQSDTHEFHNLSEDPNFSKIKKRLSLGIPAKVAAIVGIPRNSPYNLTRHSK